MSSVSELIKEQGALQEQLKGFIKNFEKSPKDRLAKAGHIQGRIDVLNALWQDFSSNDKAIRTSATTQDRQDVYFLAGLYEEVDYSYCEYVGILNEILVNLTSPPPSFPSEPTKTKDQQNDNEQTAKTTNTNANDTNDSFSESFYNEVKLPRITIPTFSGDYSTWPSFYDLFRSIIHQKEHLSPVQKMHYLKSCLSGEAEQMIRHLTITHDIYKVAWDMLCKRYQNTRVLVNNYLKILLSQPHLQAENSSQIQRLLDSTNECIAALKNLSIETDTWDPMIVFIVVDRLPLETRQLCEQEQGASTSLTKFKELCEFLVARFRTLEALPTTKSQRIPFRSQESKPRAFHVTKFQCPMCKGPHALKNCTKFGRLTAQERSQVVSSKSLCYNCLAQSHVGINCPSTQHCRFCQKRHNSLLHIQNNPKDTLTVNRPQASDVSPPSQLNTPSSQISSYLSRKRKDVLLATILVRVFSHIGEPHILRALVDLGSQATFVRQSTVQQLGLKPYTHSNQIAGLANVLTAESDKAVRFKIQPYTETSPSIELDAVILKTLTDLLPPRKISISEWNHNKDLKLADLSFNKPGNIDIIIDAAVYGKIIQNGLIRSGPGKPVAQNTTFGWIIFGEVPSEHSSYSSEKKCNLLVNFCNQVEECDLMKRFWEVEEVSLPPKLYPGDALCEDHYKKTHSRILEGRYVVRLPFDPSSQDNFNFKGSRDIAIKRYSKIEDSLEKNQSLKSDYNRCLKEYLDLGQMEKVPKTVVMSSESIAYYLPHHAVIKADSITTRTRVVFDASCKTSSGYSLNDLLLPGPPLQRDITLLLFEWRQKRYVFTADIAQMYRQILIDPIDHDYQRIIWREPSLNYAEDFRLLTVTFGVRCAPFLAIRTLHQLAEDEGVHFPVGDSILSKDLYVDDVLSGANTISEAVEARNQIDEILKRGQTRASNDERVLADIPESKRLFSLSLLFDKESKVKTLGVVWKPLNDCFSYDIQIEHTSPPYTKRKVLSTLARICDPLGLLAPITVISKILLQSLWQRLG